MAGQPVQNVVQLAANGSLDAGFDAGSGPNAAVNALALQANGEVILGGAFTVLNGQTATVPGSG